MGKVIHFEIPISDEKNIKFYENVFDWKMSNYGDMEYWLVMAGNDGEAGINGALIKKKDGEEYKDISSAEGSVNAVVTVSVDSLDEAIKRIEENGGKVVTEKMTIPGVGVHVYFHDPDGNLIGAMQNDQNAGM